MSRNHKKQKETEILTPEEETEEIPEEWETDMPDEPENEPEKKGFFSRVFNFIKEKGEELLFEDDEEEEEEEEIEDSAPEEELETEIIIEDAPQEDLISEPEPEIIEEPPQEDLISEPESEIIEELPQEDLISEPESEIIEELPQEDLIDAISVSENFTSFSEESPTPENAELTEAPDLMPEELPQFDIDAVLPDITAEKITEPEADGFDAFSETQDPEDALPDLDYLDEEIQPPDMDTLPDLEYLEDDLSDSTLEDIPPELPEEPENSSASEPEEVISEPKPLFRIFVTAAILIIFILVIILCFKNGVFSEKEGYHMPDLVGQNYYTLEDNNLSLDIQIDKSDYSAYEKDIIYAQDIPPGADVMPGQTVHISVSMGLAMTQVPDIKNYQYEYADKVLKQAGFEAEYFYEKSLDGTEEYNIIRTEPPIGSEVPLGSKLTVYVSQGLGSTAALVQDVVGKPLEEAVNLCKMYGLDVETIGVPSLQPVNTVLTQSLEPAITVNFHTVITLTYSNGEAPQGTVEFNLELPPYANGRFILDFINKDGTVIASSGMIIAGFSAGSMIPVEGYGAEQITVILNNDTTNQQAELGTYEFDFTTGVCTPLTEDIQKAFEAVGGIG